MNRKPLRVAVVSRSVYPLHRYGGLERHCYDLVRSLLVRDVRVTLIAPPPFPHRPREPDAEAVYRHPHVTFRPVPYVTFPFSNRRGTTILDRITAYPAFGMRAGRLAAELATRDEIDVVHGMGASVLGYAGVPRGSWRAPLVMNPHGLEEFGATDPTRAPLKRVAYWPLRLAVRRCGRAADRIIATDRALVEPVVAHLGVNLAVVRVIPNAIDVSECDRPAVAARASELAARIGLTPDDVLLLSAGRIDSSKGFDVLLRALVMLRERRRTDAHWRWVLVGDGPQRSGLEREIAAAGLQRHVVVWGRALSEDLHAWYRAATVFVHPTLYEGSSLVTLEAMAHSRPVIATRAGGLPDKVFDGVNGWLVPPGDAHALADACERAIIERARLAEMGEESRAIVERDFTLDAVTDRLLEMYRELLAPVSASR
jgi:glycogen synthase